VFTGDTSRARRLFSLRGGDGVGVCEGLGVGTGGVMGGEVGRRLWLFGALGAVFVGINCANLKKFGLPPR
jgi:hypothetical protein